jgi:MFS family permease
MMVALSQVHTFGLFVVMAALTGVTAELFGPAGHALVADLVPAPLRVTAFGALRLAINAGFAFGPAMAGWLAQRSFLWLFLGDAATTLVFGIIAWTLLPSGHQHPRSDTHWREDFAQVLGDRAFRVLWIATAAAAVVFFQTNSSFAMHVKASGFDPQTYGNLCAMNGILIVLFELPLTQITQRFRPEWTMAAGYTVIGLAFGLNGLSSTLACLTASMVLLTLGEMLNAPYSAAFAAELAPPHLRGRYMGAQSMAWTQAFILAPILGTHLYETAPRLLWSGGVAVGFLSGALMLHLSRMRRHPAAPGAAPRKN